MDNPIQLVHSQFLAILAALVPAPLPSRVASIMEMQRLANPQNDPYKPKRYSDSDISAALRVKDAGLIIDAVNMGSTIQRVVGSGKM